MSSSTNKIYYGIDKDGIKRVWGVTREDCKLARKEYLAEKSKIWKPFASHMQIRIFEEDIDE